MIFLSHFSWDSMDVWDFGGDCGVCFFFMLSGFVLSLAPAQKSFREFIRRRIFKIYPAHLLALLVAFACMPWAFNVASSVAALTMTQSWYPTSGIYFGANGVAWFLSDLVVFYMLFPFIRRAVFGCRPGRLLLICILVIVGYIGLLVPSVPDEKVNWLLYVFPPVRAVDFIMGVILARVFMWIRCDEKMLSSVMCHFCEITALALMVCAYIIYPHVSERWTSSILFWLPCAAVILAFALTDVSPGMVGRVIRHKFMLWLGAISFEFYLIHVSVISLSHRISNNFDVTLPPVVALAGIAAITVILAALFKKIAAGL